MTVRSNCDHGVCVQKTFIFKGKIDPWFAHDGFKDLGKTAAEKM